MAAQHLVRAFVPSRKIDDRDRRIESVRRTCFGIGHLIPVREFARENTAEVIVVQRDAVGLVGRCLRRRRAGHDWSINYRDRDRGNDVRNLNQWSVGRTESG